MVAAKETQKTFVQNLAGLPARPAPLTPGQLAQPTDWSKLLALIGTSMGEIQSSILETRIKIRQTQKDIEDVQKKITELAPSQVKRTETRINLVAGSALTGELIIRYQVRSAGWEPQYDARLTTGGPNQAPVINLIRRAAVRQNSGEAWRDVAMSLSTSRPSGRSAAPTLRARGG